MSEHPNAALLRRLYNGDVEALYRRLAPEYVVHTPGRNAIAGDYYGEAGHREHREAFMRMTHGTMGKQLLDTFLANDQWGLVPSRLTARRDGKVLDLEAFGIWRFRDGLVAEHWGLVPDQAAFDDFFQSNVR